MRWPAAIPASISSATRYAQLAQALLADIAGGRYPVGARLLLHPHAGAPSRMRWSLLSRFALAFAIPILDSRILDKCRG
jgi:hypothetical protein